MPTTQTHFDAGLLHGRTSILFSVGLGFMISCSTPASPSARKQLTREQSPRCQLETESLLISPRAEAERLTATRECQLSEDISTLPGVVSATVRITPESQPSWNSPKVPARASVLLSSAPLIDTAPIRSHLSAAIAGLDENRIRIAQIPTPTTQSSPAPAMPATTLLLGHVEVSTDSVGTAKAWLAALLLSNLLTAGLLALIWFRFKKRPATQPCDK